MTEKTKKDKRIRQFDFSKHAKRHVAFIVTYLGWDYGGMVVQDTTDKTIEEELFGALEKVKLVENRDMCSYQRCGRTDKGVSGFRQVVSLDVRSNLMEGRGVFVPEGSKLNESSNSAAESELNFPLVLNRVLPPEIRILAWAPVDEGFSARFNCTKRVYKYFFPQGNMNIEAMTAAGNYLIGTHDFRNFCRLDRDKSKVQTTIREIKNVTVKHVEESTRADDPYRLCEVTVVGSGFLYHQIRYTVSVLFAVGEGKESPQVVQSLLDVQKMPRKPQYDMAVDFPLCLWDCSYEDYDLHWIWDNDNVDDVQEKRAKKAKQAEDIESASGSNGSSESGLSKKQKLNEEEIS